VSLATSSPTRRTVREHLRRAIVELVFDHLDTLWAQFVQPDAWSIPGNCLLAVVDCRHDRQSAVAGHCGVRPDRERGLRAPRSDFRPPIHQKRERAIGMYGPGIKAFETITMPIRVSGLIRDGRNRTEERANRRSRSGRTPQGQRQHFGDRTTSTTAQVDSWPKLYQASGCTNAPRAYPNDEHQLHDRGEDVREHVAPGRDEVAK